MNIDDMVAGAALDDLVAEKVMGWHQAEGGINPRQVWLDAQNKVMRFVNSWRPSTNITQAFEAVFILEEEYWMKLASPFGPPAVAHDWHAGFTPHSTTAWNVRPDWRASGETPQLAICRAALKVRMEEPTL